MAKCLVRLSDFLFGSNTSWYYNGANGDIACDGYQLYTRWLHANLWTLYIFNLWQTRVWKHLDFLSLGQDWSQMWKLANEPLTSNWIGEWSNVSKSVGEWWVPWDNEEACGQSNSNFYQTRIVDTQGLLVRKRRRRSVLSQVSLTCWGPNLFGMVCNWNK